MTVQLLTVLSSHPRGLTLEELARKINHADLTSLARQLRDLQQQKLVRHQRRRWISTAVGGESATQKDDQPTVRAPRKSKIQPILPRIEALPLRTSQQTSTHSSAPSIKPESAFQVSALLRYYSLCLAAEERVDASAGWHEAGERFVPVHLAKTWWPDRNRPAAYAIHRQSLPPTFQGALGRAATADVVRLGYPLDVFEPAAGELMVRAVATLPLRWKVAERDVIVFEPVESGFVLNPTWLSYQRKTADIAALARRIGAGLDTDDGTEAAGDSFDLVDLCTALNLALAQRRISEIEPLSTATHLVGSKGLQNAAALFLVSDTRFSAGAIRDLNALSEHSREALKDTALGTLLGLSPPAPSVDVPVLEPVDLTFGQNSAVRSGLSEGLTVITGPPGTGKSQVVAGIVASAAFAGKTVLFASRNHAAIDAVEQRLDDLSPERPIVLRLNQRWGEGPSVRLDKLIASLVARPASSNDFAILRRRVEALSSLDRERKILVERAKAIAAARAEVAQKEEELAAAISMLGISVEQLHSLPTAGPVVRSGGRAKEGSRLAQFLTTWVKGYLGLKPHSEWTSAGCPDPKRNVAAHQQWVDTLARAQAAENAIPAHMAMIPEEAEQASIGERLHELNARIRTEASAAIMALAAALDWCSDDEHAELLELHGSSARDRVPVEAIRILLKHYPVWACSNLAVSRFAPLELGLFDYVVMDETSQCDIGSAIPLLARARRAVIVGDPAQLPFVSNLSRDWETETLAQLGLADVRGIGRLRQSQNSLFDVASTVPGASRHLLTDHFRCHPDIAQYFSSFYGDQLSVMTDESRLQPPQGARPGLDWEDVTSPIEAARTGCHAPKEAAAILHAIQDLFAQGYSGTIGVCTPFREQAKRITDLINANLPTDRVEKARLVAQTANGFQGDARDVIFFSLCVGPGMPNGSLSFVREGANLFNVAISRAKAVCRVFGNRAFAASAEIPHIRRLLVACERSAQRREDTLTFESPWEQRFFEALKEQNIHCVPQFPLAGRRLDLAWFDRSGTKINIEVDGDRYHRDPNGLRKIDDLWRDHQIRSLGWKVLRFWVYELREDMNGCVERVRNAIAA